MCWTKDRSGVFTNLLESRGLDVELECGRDGSLKAQNRLGMLTRKKYPGKLMAKGGHGMNWTRSEVDLE